MKQNTPIKKLKQQEKEMELLNEMYKWQDAAIILFHLLTEEQVEKYESLLKKLGLM